MGMEIMIAVFKLKELTAFYPQALLSVVLALALPMFGNQGETISVADFTHPGHNWKGNHSIAVESREGAFRVALTGEDPWVESGMFTLPEMEGVCKLKILLDAECSNSGECRLYVATPEHNFNETDAANLHFHATPTPHYSGIIPLKSRKLRFRIDPPGSSGRFTLRSLKVEPLKPAFQGEFAPPLPIDFNHSFVTIATERLILAHSENEWNSFVCFVNGLLMARSNPGETPVYKHNGNSFVLDLRRGTVSTKKKDSGFCVTCRIHDQHEAEWLFVRDFSVDGNTLRISTSLRVDQPREIAHFAWLSLFAGLDNTFGRSKQQALLPGIEYLENEPSSNEKEIKGAAANRRLVERYKLCYPLMAINADDRWLALNWREPTPELSTVFDSPDRIFNSGGHLLGLWSPAVGEDRLQGETEVYGTMRLEGGRTYTVQAAIIGGSGGTAVDVMIDYVQRHGLPELPEFAPGFDGAVELLAYGWLKSAARDGLRWRHAVWGDRFKPSLAPDVPAYMLWLAANIEEATLKKELQKTAERVIAQLSAGHPGVGGVSHIKLPLGALLYGDLEAHIRKAADRVRQSAATLAANNGYAIYRQAKDKPDYAETLDRAHCNGFTAITAEKMLQDATLTGERDAIAAALRALDRMTKLYAGGVPRGAQPWEMPLHTPDIMASAHLTRCYVLGYLLSGRAEYLEQARYWAWSGLSMIYLAPPVDGAVGLYATIAVMGATNWVAPNWIGQPVQWCGLVYRSALEELARIDDQLGDTWRRIARGITITGLQMTFPIDDPDNLGGLLPDYFLLKQQKRDGPAINPGTVQANLAEVYGKTPMYTLTRLSNGMLIHAPGEVTENGDADGTITLKIDAWPKTEYKVLVTGIHAAPGKVRWNSSRDVRMNYLTNAKALIVYLSGDGVLSVTE
jgi:hypothetical protein